MKLLTRPWCFLHIWLVVGFLCACSSSEREPGRYEDKAEAATPKTGAGSAASGDWDAANAAAYLDRREEWWMSWSGAARDHGTFCVSCHTAMPYFLSRAVLRKELREDGPTIGERLLVVDVSKRVLAWKQSAPYYNDQEDGPDKTAESRATEAVLNAFILAWRDSQTKQLSEATRTAFANMWGLQQGEGKLKGAWQWEDFGLKPWEARNSSYYGAALAAIAVGVAPESYRSSNEIRPQLSLLTKYLQSNSARQPLINRVTLLWASTRLPELLTAEQKRSIVDEALASQERDGGWSLPSVSLSWRDFHLGNPGAFFGKWTRNDGTPQDVGSDGLGTGFLVFVLEEAGVAPGNQQIRRGRDWLVRHQNRPEGSWTASSLNKRRVSTSNAGRFMSDAATAFAVLALSYDQDAPAH